MASSPRRVTARGDGAVENEYWCAGRGIDGELPDLGVANRVANLFSRLSPVAKAPRGVQRNRTRRSGAARPTTTSGRDGDPAKCLERVAGRSRQKAGAGVDGVDVDTIRSELAECPGEGRMRHELECRD
jgi:hypothetical protein